MTALLTVEDLRVVLGSGASRTEVLHGLSFDLEEGSTLAVVGESGSGKSTLAKTIVGVHRSTEGRLLFRGDDITVRRGTRARESRRRMQLIPQDPYSSLDPRRTVAHTLAEAIDPRRASVDRNAIRITQLLDLVRLPADSASRYPREFSGGQRQRIAIARALAVEPDLIIADEVTSALDLSTQDEILRLLDDLKRDLGLTMIFVSHNLAVVQRMADRVLVLLNGDVVELGDQRQVFQSPRAEYTRSLLDSVPGGPGFDLG